MKQMFEYEPIGISNPYECANINSITSSIKKYICFCIITIFCSCNNIDTRTNVPEDIQEGKKIAEKFYDDIINRDFEEAASLMDKSISKKEGIEVLIKIDSIVGALKNFKFKEGTSSKITKNGKLQTYRIELFYNGEYTKNKTEEKLIIVSYKDRLVIDGYWPNLLVYESH